MRAKGLSMVLLAGLLTFTVAAWQRHHSHLPARTAADPAWGEWTASVARMHSSMTSVRPSGNTDVDFATLMLPHHRAAIDMARTELMFGTDPRMRRLAQEIVTDQQSEIELMQLWLKQPGGRP
jgi:uncharacterized protein (DUF305 family)